MDIKYLTNYLTETISSREIVSVFVDPNDSSLFTPGFVEYLDPNWVAIKIVDTYGLFDGYGIRPLNKICDVISKSDYEEKLTYLAQLKPKPIFKVFELDLHKYKGDILDKTLAFAHYKDLVVTIWLKEDEREISGYIKNIFNSTITIFQLKKFGYAAGKSEFYIDDILMLDVGCNFEQALNLLYKRRILNKGNL